MLLHSWLTELETQNKLLFIAGCGRAIVGTCLRSWLVETPLKQVVTRMIDVLFCVPIFSMHVLIAWGLVLGDETIHLRLVNVAGSLLSFFLHNIYSKCQRIDNIFQYLRKGSLSRQKQNCRNAAYSPTDLSMLLLTPPGLVFWFPPQGWRAYGLSSLPLNKKKPRLIGRMVVCDGMRQTPIEALT